MDQMNENVRQGCACGCRGPDGAKRASETQPHREDRVAGAALDILDERFARGEIDKAEYQEKKQLISQRAAVPKADQSEQGADAPRSPPRPAKSARKGRR